MCRSDYEPAELDILQAEGLSQGSGLVQIEISLDDKDLGSWQDADTQVAGLDRYALFYIALCLQRCSTFCCESVHFQWGLQTIGINQKM